MADDRDPETGQFVKGKKGGPGRPVGSRNKLGEAFLSALNDDFEEHGQKAIETVRSEKPDQYLKVIASILPREMTLTVSDPMEDLTDDELIDRLRTLHDSIATFVGDGSGGAEAGAGQAPSKGKSGRVH